MSVPCRVWKVLRVALGGLSLLPAAACGQEPRAESARDLVRHGQYASAVTAANSALARDSNDVASARALVRALHETGALPAALASLRAWEARPALKRATALEAGYVHKERGALAEAAAAFQTAAASQDSLLARYELALLQHERGEPDLARVAFDRMIDVYNAGRRMLSSSDLRAVGLSCRMLGRENPQLYKDALRALDEAVSRDSLDVAALTDLGELFLEKYSGPEARESLTSALRINPYYVRALLAMARLNVFDGRPGADSLVKQALVVNARHAGAHAAAALQLIDVERYQDAAAQAQRGLVDDSLAAAPLVALAAAEYLAGNAPAYRAALDRAHLRLRNAADAEVTLAEYAGRNRLYREAAEFATAGIARDPRASKALSALGMNQLRLGNVSEAAANLNKAFAIDPYDVWVKNTLDLVDTFKDYVEVETPRVTMVAERKDAPLLELFVLPLAEEALDSLSKRYGFVPQGRVRVELFRSHADFSVRTVGLAGLGALGVSFGNVLAMDSPAARRVGEFNWGSTLWHELTHTVTLGTTNNRIPRWLSEGLSTYEERRARPGWGSEVSPPLVAAYKGGTLHPISKLNDGFVRPRYPEEVPLSYALASFVCEMIEAEHGIKGIRALLEGYRQGKSTAETFSTVTGLTSDALDAKFDTWFRTRFAREFRAVDPGRPGGSDGVGATPWGGPLADAMRAAAAQVASQRWEAAIATLTAAKTLFPTWGDGSSPYGELARIYLTKGDTAKAMAELAEVSARDETAYTSNRLLAALRKARGDVAGAQRALERAMFISPFDLGAHDSLAVVATLNNAHAAAIRARRAIVALDPSDRVEALYQLALSFAKSGDLSSARREVLRALDLAPNYEKAQELLLTLKKPEPQ